MAVRDHVTRVAKLRAKIVTVEPSQRLIEAVTADGGTPRRLSLTDIPSGFQWPKEGEEWSIYEENGYWRLGNKFLNSKEEAAFTELDPGVSLAPDKAQTLDGGEAVIIHGAPAIGQVATWDGSQWIPSVKTPVTNVLPTANLYDGLEIYYQTQFMALSGVPPWHLRYRLTNPDGSPNVNAKKWEPIAATDLESNTGSASTTSTVPAIGTVSAPSLVVPLEGIYDIEWGGRLYQVNQAGGSAQLSVMVNGAYSGLNIDSYQGSAGVGVTLFASNVTRKFRTTNVLTAGVTLAVYISANTGTAQADYRYLRLRPVLVG